MLKQKNNVRQSTDSLALSPEESSNLDKNQTKSIINLFFHDILSSSDFYTPDTLIEKAYLYLGKSNGIKSKTEPIYTKRVTLVEKSSSNIQKIAKSIGTLNTNASFSYSFGMNTAPLY